MPLVVSTKGHFLTLYPVPESGVELCKDAPYEILARITGADDHHHHDHHEHVMVKEMCVSRCPKENDVILVVCAMDDGSLYLVHAELKGEKLVHSRTPRRVSLSKSVGPATCIAMSANPEGGWRLVLGVVGATKAATCIILDVDGHGTSNNLVAVVPSRGVPLDARLSFSYSEPVLVIAGSSGLRIRNLAQMRILPPPHDFAALAQTELGHAKQQLERFPCECGVQCAAARVYRVLF